MSLIAIQRWCVVLVAATGFGMAAHDIARLVTQQEWLVALAFLGGFGAGWAIVLDTFKDERERR